MTHENTAVLLLAHGTPNTLDEMPEYLAKVTGGRALPPQVVAELQHRYAQIGLRDTPGSEAPPLTRWTLEQGRLLQLALEHSGHAMPVYAAMRNWHPFIADVVRQIRDPTRADGVTRILALCLAPQNSSTSTGLYRRALIATLEADALQNPSAPKPALTFVEEWSEEPALIEAFAQRLAAAYPRACAEASAASGTEATLPVLFTAHSVPCRTVQSSESNPAPDPYPIEAKRTAALVFAAAAREIPKLKSWFFAFQSQGVGGGPGNTWLGPTVEDTLQAIRDEGHAAVVLQPIGFLCDHVEILYDIDIAFAETARGLGLRLYRTQSLNDSPLLTEALLHVVTRQLTSHTHSR